MQSRASGGAKLEMRGVDQMKPSRYGYDYFLDLLLLGIEEALPGLRLMSAMFNECWNRYEAGES